MSGNVELKNVSRIFDGTPVVNSISFQVPQGSFFSLLGPSGCGKSTTLRMIAGFEHPDEGTITIGDALMNAIPPSARPTNMVFQRWALFPHMSVRNNIAFGLRAARLGGPETSQRVERSMELTGLTGLGDRKPKQLSGGQMQRVALARALVMRPKVLLLDEPLGALDLKMRLHLQVELKRIQREVGTTFIYVTHDQTEAMSMSDQIAVMRGGIIEQIDSPQRIYEKPSTRFVADFIGNTNFVPCKIVELRGSEALVVVGGQEIVVPADSGETGKLYELAIRHERTKISRNDAQVSGFHGEITGVTFGGNSLAYAVRLNDSELSITAVQDHAGDTFQIGDPVVIEFDVDKVSLFALGAGPEA